jgi:putative addiction module component (TIGR02574 family)
MSSLLNQLKNQLGGLSRENRAELAEFLLSSLLEGPADSSIEANWDEEASRRAEAIRSGLVKVRPVEDFLAELENSQR